jgi:ribonucleotide reductase beta subunit family protein with ferritin-like domain
MNENKKHYRSESDDDLCRSDLDKCIKINENSDQKIFSYSRDKRFREEDEDVKRNDKRIKIDESLNERIDKRIIRRDNSRFIVIPQRMDLWKLYKQASNSYWLPEEIDLTRDLADWNKMNEKERKFISKILSFFAMADGIVNENIVERFIREVEFIEAKNFYGFQVMIENIHAEVYALLITTYINDPFERDELFKGIDSVHCIKKKARWIQNWIVND